MIILQLISIYLVYQIDFLTHPQSLVLNRDRSDTIKNLQRQESRTLYLVWKQLLSTISLGNRLQVRDLQPTSPMVNPAPR